MGALSGKTVLLVTHQVDFLPTFDSILVSNLFCIHFDELVCRLILADFIQVRDLTEFYFVIS